MRERGFALGVRGHGSGEGERPGEMGKCAGLLNNHIEQNQPKEKLSDTCEPMPPTLFDPFHNFISRDPPSSQTPLLPVPLMLANSTLLSVENSGATRRSRTGDLLITNQLLYQLS